MTTLEKATQKSMTRPSRSVHQRSFLWALCQELVRSTIHRIPPLSGAGLPFSEITPISSRLFRISLGILNSQARSRWTLECSGNSPAVSSVGVDPHELLKEG